MTGTSEMVRRTRIGIVRCPCCLPVINRETGPALPPLRNRGGICEPGSILAAKRVSCEQATGPGSILRIEDGSVCRIRRGATCKSGDVGRGGVGKKPFEGFAPTGPASPKP